ncbi:branched-chain amino acid ABC transporter ATP-binding protein/permease [Castellaniella sp.]|uniref:branched-chain amino acid ABC transporter ATP-binding protein/permease n=1 Tax=Castellaniella sp. TaxID=1955812 RepID=UPI002AFF0704|nr:branched-chain amino acid ABC transporter ATP-binding protein/permease [Castellaniella sp.]
MKPLASKISMAVLAVVFLLAPLFFGTFTVSLLNEIGIGALVALGLVLLTGVGGATSFGQATFVGIAAYASAWLTINYDISPWLGLPFALLLTGLSALAIGMLTLRLGGHFLALSTIAWGLSISMLFGNIDALGRHTGLSGIPPVTIGGWSLMEPQAMYYLVWTVVGLGFLFSRNLLDSRPGRAIRGLRGGATLLASVGADAYRLRLSLFVTAALLAGLAGWLYAHMNRFVSPSPFSVHASIEYLLMAVAGGLGSLVGALLGSGLVLALKNALQDVLPWLTQRAGQLDSVVFSALFIALLHFARGGLMAFVRRWQRRYGPSRPVLMPVAPARLLPRRVMPTAGTPILSVQGAVKRFGGLVAVNEVSFDLNAGEILGLIGPNGAGKSTMFNLLTGTLSMTSGQVQFLGRNVSGMLQLEIARLGLGRTFQHVKLRPYMSLLDNVALGVHARTRPSVLRAGLRLDREEERRIMHEAWRQLDRIGLSDRAHETAGSLPLGTQRILEIARALASDPVLLVLDEPAAGLRRQEKLALSKLLRQLREEGMTILIVEHDMDFVMNLVDRLVVMNFGSKLVEGVPSAVRADKRVQDAYLGGTA